MTKDEIIAILEKELASIQDQAVVAWLRDHLIDPRPTELLWEYGNEEPHSAWVVGDTREHNVVIAYCEGGHGAYGNPWGLIRAKDVYFGMDCSWFPCLQAAVYEGSSVPAPQGWEVP